MRILFDQGTAVPLRRYLHPHAVDTLAELGWSELRNGQLLDQAQEHGYQALVTTDQNLQYQQNLTGRTIRILVLKTTSWPRIKRQAHRVLEALELLEVGGYAEVEF